MTRQKDNQEIETFSQEEAAEMGAFPDDALTEDEALAAMEGSDETGASNE